MSGSKKLNLLIGCTIFLTLTAFSDERANVFIKEYREMKVKLEPRDKYDLLYIEEWEKIIGAPILPKYKILKESKMKLTGGGVWHKFSKSPFAPYLEKDFSLGLTAVQSKRHFKAINSLDCDAAFDLELQGFLNLHHFLRQLFMFGDGAIHKKELVDIFNKVAYRHSLAINYCLDVRSIKSSDSLAKENDFTFPLYHMRYMEIHFTPKDLIDYIFSSNERWKHINRCLSFRGIIALAISDRYKPAIITLLELTKKPDGIRLPENMEYYLYKMAEQLDIKQGDKYQQLKQSISESEREKLDAKVLSNQPLVEWGKLADCSSSWF